MLKKNICHFQNEVEKSLDYHMFEIFFIMLIFFQKIFKILPFRIISAAFVTLSYLFFVHYKVSLSTVQKAESEDYGIEVENINTIYDMIKKG